MRQFFKQEHRQKPDSLFLSGSFTVEAVIIASVTIFVLGALIIATFYVHDRAVSQGIVCEIAAAGSSYATEKERKKAVEKCSSLMNAERFLGSRNLSGSTSVNSSKVSASCTAAYPVPGFAMQYFSDGELPIEVSWSSAVANPSRMIRLIRGAQGMVDELKDMFSGGNN